MLIENEFVVQAPTEDVWRYLLDVERVAPCMPGAQLTDVVDEHTWKGKTNIKVGPVSLSFAGTVVMEERDDVAHRVVLNAKGMEQRGKGAASAKVESHLEDDSGGTKIVMKTDLTITGAVAQYGRGMIQDISQRLTKEFADCLQANIQAAGSSSAVAPAEPAPAAEPPSAPHAAATQTETSAPAVPAASAPTSSPTTESAAPEDAPAAAATPPVETTPGVTTRPPAPSQPVRTAAPVRGIRLTLWAVWRALIRFVRRLFGMRNA